MWRTAPTAKLEELDLFSYVGAVLCRGFTAFVPAGGEAVCKVEGGCCLPLRAPHTALPGKLPLVFAWAHGSTHGCLNLGLRTFLTEWGDS